MVSQRTEDSAASLPEAPDFEQIASEMEAAGDFVDSTPQDEAEVATPAEPSERPPTEEPEAEVEGTEDQNSEEALPEEEPEPEGAPVQEQEPEPEQPSRLYDDPEFRKWQSQKDRELAEARKQIEQITAEKEKADAAKQVDEQVEDYLKREERDAVARGYGEEDVKNLVRDPQRVQQVRRHFQQQQQIQTYEQALHVAGKQIAARRYAEQYNVAEEDIPILMDTESPEAMERIAKRVGLASVQKNGASATRKAAVPAENNETAPVATRSNAPEKPGFWELAEAAESKEYGELTPDEREVIDRIYRGQIPEE